MGSQSPAPSKAVDDNKVTVEALYKALSSGDSSTISRLLAMDLEWWFHGPRHCQHMMRVLTGESACGDFRFKPRRVTAVGNWVIAEGWEGAQVYWVHVWTLSDDGVIAQLREYFNTWLTVQVLGPLVWDKGSTIWQSEPLEHSNRSLPGLVLAL